MKKIVLVLIATMAIGVASGQRSSRRAGSPEVKASEYIAKGDALSAAGADPGEIAGEYEQAKYFDPQNPLPYLRLAEVYRHASPSTALENVRKAIELDPGNTRAQGLLGKVYLSLGRYPEAIEAFRTSFSAGDYSVDDIEHIARAYYFGEADKLGMSEEAKFTEAGKWVNEGLAREPDHFILNRYRMYLDAATGVSTAEDAEKFFSLAGGENKLLPGDYIMYGTILAYGGDADGAIARFDKAIELDPEGVEAPNELISLGNRYYKAGTRPQTDSLVRRESLLAADKFFTRLTELAPESYTGYSYLARTANALYPAAEGIENGIPKERYARTVEVIEGRGDEPMSAGVAGALKEGLGYLAYYYYMTDDLDNALLYSDKLLALDPEHPNATAIKADILSRQ